MFNSGNLNENLSRTFGDDITKEKLNQKKSSEKENFAEENLTLEEEENQILDMGSMFGKLFRGRPAQMSRPRDLEQLLSLFSSANILKSDINALIQDHFPARKFHEFLINKDTEGEQALKLRFLIAVQPLYSKLKEKKVDGNFLRSHYIRVAQLYFSEDSDESPSLSNSDLFEKIESSMKKLKANEKQRPTEAQLEYLEKARNDMDVLNQLEKEYKEFLPHLPKNEAMACLLSIL